MGGCFRKPEVRWLGLLLGGTQIAACTLSDELEAWIVEEPVELGFTDGGMSLPPASVAPPSIGPVDPAGAAASVGGSGPTNAGLSPDAGSDGVPVVSSPQANADGGFEVGGSHAGDAGGDPSAVIATTIYWVDSTTDSVNRVGIDGADQGQIANAETSSSFFRSVAVDGEGRKLYVTDAGVDRIRRCDLDGSNLEDLIVDVASPMGIDLDVERQMMYFATRGESPAVLRARLDGSDLQEVISGELINPYGVVLDLAQDKLYVIDNGNDTLLQSNLDGTELQAVEVDTGPAPIELALDPVGGKLYWSELDTPAIIRADLDGSNREVLITPDSSPALTTPLGIVVDHIGRQLYFVDGGSEGTDTIKVAELDGSNVRPLVDAPGAPRGLDLGFALPGDNQVE